MSESQHWIYIALAYGATFAIVGVLVLRIFSDHRRLTAELRRLQDKGSQE